MSSGIPSWKKQITRFQQRADQRLGRSEKTELLNEDLQVLEKRVDLIKQACHSTAKRLKDLLGGPSDEKKLKKMPEFALSVALQDSGGLLEHKMLGQSMALCGDMEEHLAKERLQMETEAEVKVLGPLNNILEVDIPAIHKQKKQLSKAILDMDAAKTKFQSAERALQSGNLSANKMTALKDEWDEACHKVNQCRDQLTTDLNIFIARENEISKLILQLVDIQVIFHTNALDRLHLVRPQLNEEIVCSSGVPVYSQPLEDHLRRTNRKIAAVLEKCVCALLKYGLEEEGLFRIAGGASRVKKLRAELDSGHADMGDFEHDPHSIAGALKLYLRELPEPLMTYGLYDEWMKAAHTPLDERLNALWNVVYQLPTSNLDNLRYLVKFLAKLSELSSINKMTPSNIAIVVGPNLLWPPGENGPSVLSTGMQSGILEALVSNADWFFQGDIEFHESTESCKKPDVIMTPPSREKSGRHKSGKSSVFSGLSLVHSTITAPLQKPPLPPNSRSSCVADYGLSPDPGREGGGTRRSHSADRELSVHDTCLCPSEDGRGEAMEEHLVAGPDEDFKKESEPVANAAGHNSEAPSVEHQEPVQQTQTIAPINNLTPELLDTVPTTTSSTSPRAPRRVKKTAPPPPADKVNSADEQRNTEQSKTKSLDRTESVRTNHTAEVVSKSSTLGRLESLRVGQKPERPTASPDPPMSPRHQEMERPKGPPPERPQAPPPDKPSPSPEKQDHTEHIIERRPSVDRLKAPPEKPAPPVNAAKISAERQAFFAGDKSAEKSGPSPLFPNSDKDKPKPEKPDKLDKAEKPEKPPSPSVMRSGGSVKLGDKPGRPAKPSLPDKPQGMEEKPSGHQRQPSSGGGKPPRPQPPPPPKPE